MDSASIQLDSVLAGSLRKALEVLEGILDDAAATTSHKLRAACTILRISMSPPWSRPSPPPDRLFGSALAPAHRKPPASTARPVASSAAVSRPSPSPAPAAILRHDLPRPAFDLLTAAGTSPPALAPPPGNQVRLKSATFP